MNVRPMHDRIIIKPIENETTTKSGIVIPDAAQEKPMQGTVIGVGGGRVTEEGNTIPMSVKEGDVVLYSKFAGQTVKIDNVDHIVLKEDDVLAIVE